MMSFSLTTLCVGSVKEMLSSEDLLVFLETCGSSSETFVNLLTSDEHMADIAFLIDICGHHSALNLKLQGKDKLIANLYSAVKSFHLQLSLFASDIRADSPHFPCLKLLRNEREDIDVQCYCDHINKLSEEFSRRFISDFDKKERLTQLIKVLLIARIDGDWSLTISELAIDLSVAAMHMELCNLQTTNNEFFDQSSNKGIVSWYPNMSQIVLWLCTIFSSIYLCEFAISKMNLIKSKQRAVPYARPLSSISEISMYPDETRLLKHFKC